MSLYLYLYISFLFASGSIYFKLFGNLFFLRTADKRTAKWLLVMTRGWGSLPRSVASSMTSGSASKKEQGPAALMKQVNSGKKNSACVVDQKNNTKLGKKSHIFGHSSQRHPCQILHCSPSPLSSRFPPSPPFGQQLRHSQSADGKPPS